MVDAHGQKPRRYGQDSHPQRHAYDATLIVAAAAAEARPSPDVRSRLLASLEAPAKYTVGADEGQWMAPGLPGIRVKILAVDRQRGLMTMLRPGDFHHADADSDNGEITTTDGAEVLIVGAIDDYMPGDAHA